MKVVLVGDRLLYYLLSYHDPEFLELFKVEADFSVDMERNRTNERAYACMLKTLLQRAELRAFDQRAVARVIEYSARLTGQADRLSLRLREIDDLLREADFWAREAKHNVVRLADVQRALDERVFRANRFREKILAQQVRKTVMIETEGEKVGQINGLSVLRLGKFSFGKVSRITSRAWVGRGTVIDVERKVDLGGTLHTKGVLILTHFLNARYAVSRALSFSASLVFEQSYGGIDGDSASSAELYALLSAVSGIPIRQDLAVTGSVSQHGQIQAIGGVNQKVEGFFQLWPSSRFDRNPGGFDSQSQSSQFDASSRYRRGCQARRVPSLRRGIRRSRNGDTDGGTCRKTRKTRRLHQRLTQRTHRKKPPQDVRTRHGQITANTPFQKHDKKTNGNIPKKGQKNVSGFVGIVRFDGRAVEASALAKMLQNAIPPGS